MLLCKTKNVGLTYKRFTASHHIQIYAKFFAFCDDLIHIIEAQISLVTICTGPASLTMHIAGGCRVKENQPRNIAVVDFTVLTDHLCAAEESFKTKIQCSHFGNMRICFIQYAIDEFNPSVIRIFDSCSNLIVIFFGKSIAPELFCPVY